MMIGRLGVMGADDGARERGKRGAVSFVCDATEVWGLRVLLEFLLRSMLASI